MVSKNNIPKLERTSVTRKQFDYKIGNVTLNFSLRNDVKQELRAFQEILTAAQKDVQDEINKIGN
jgi:hypothetical protein